MGILDGLASGSPLLAERCIVLPPVSLVLHSSEEMLVARWLPW